jgi:hypothetical protein
MAVTVNDTRTTWDDADADTDWNVGVENTTDYAEANGSITEAVDTTSQHMEATKTLVDLTSTLVYVWSANIAEQNVWKPGTLADAPHCLYISDGTNDLALLQAGNDREVFKHSETQVVFQCFVIDTDYIDTKDAAGEIYEINGSVGSFDPASVTEIGAYYTTNSKSFKGWNVGCDIIRHGNGGLEVYGGTTGDRGTLAEIVAEDRSKTTGKCHGIIREYTAGTYGAQGALTFGTASATADAWFEDANVSITFEDRDIGANKYKLTVQGNSTDANHFILSNARISSAGPSLGIELNNSDIDTLSLDTVTFDGVSAQITLPTDSASYTHVVNNCTFNDCQLISPGTVDFTNNTMTNPASTNGALVISTSGTDNWYGNTVISGGTGHALFINAVGTYTLTDHTFIGFATQAGTAGDRIIFNLSSGHVVIINDGSGELSYENFLTSTTEIVNPPPTTTVFVATTGGVPVENARVFVQATDGTGPLPFEDTVNITSASTTASVAHTDHGLDNGQKIVIRGANEEEYNGVYAISNSTANAYDYTFAGSGTSPATGTIKATGVLIHDLTPSNGILTDSRSLSGNQPVTGHSRKSSATPFYKSSAIVGTVNSLTGANFTAVMILDE